MARRPKRSLQMELARHADIVSGQVVTCSSLVALYEEIVEFQLAERLLRDAEKRLRQKCDEAEPVAPSLPLVETAG